MTGLTHTLAGSSSPIAYTWTYDRASRPTAFTSSMENSGSGGTATYGYDSAGQLTSASYDYQANEAFSYDANGNRTGSGYTVGSGNEMLSDGTYTYQYDNEGNTTRRTCIADGSVTDYTWDYRNRLAEVTDRASASGAATQIVDYIYDVNNHLIEEITDPDGAGEEPASCAGFLYDRGQMVLRHTGTPGAARRSPTTISGAPPPTSCSRREDHQPQRRSNINWTLGDNLNTIRDVAQYNTTTHTTTVIDHRAYSAFGSITLETNASLDLSFGFTGRPLDTSTAPPKQPQPLVLRLDLRRRLVVPRPLRLPRRRHQPLPLLRERRRF